MKTISRTIRSLFFRLTRRLRRLFRRTRRDSQPTCGLAGSGGHAQAASAKKAAAVPAKTAAATYRADAIRFNEQFLDNRYLLRYNTMKGVTEFCPKEQMSEDGTPSPEWRPLTERDLNRITVEQLKAGGQSWSYGMKLCIDSTLVADFNPVEHYLDTCPQWDGVHDYIGELARRVPTDYAEWPAFFRRWLLAMVAQVRGMSRDHGNALVPMLIGEQGTGKTTFCKMLIPEEMRDYYMDDVKMDNAEQVERVLGRMWLVNIDEYNSKTVREQAKIKRLLTEKDVQVRRMRSDQYVKTHRTASFIATTNERQPLTDPTGSRRYICVEVTGSIDTATPVDHRQLFAQALWELAHGEPFHLTKEEEQAVVEHNEQYRAMSGADMLLMECYEPAEVCRDNLVTATTILRRLCEKAKGADRPTMRQLIEALKARHFRHGAQQGRRGWYAKPVVGNASERCE